jgi:prepilin-type N-terminal cleavage/methylation domain-containing protein
MIDQANSTRPDRACGSRASASHGATRPAAANARPGFTLIEMMVVLLILVIMTSIMIPVMSSASDTRRAREGARVLSTMLASAQTQAQVSGRPSAVWIQRLTNSAGGAINPASAIDIYLADVPPPFLGETLASTAVVTPVPNLGGPSTSATVVVSHPGSSSTSSPVTENILQDGVQTGDLIRFEFRGELYVLTYNTTTSAWTMAPLDSTFLGTAQAWPPAAALPFQIFRRPVKSMASAVQLSDGVAIDLAWSGADPNWALSLSAPPTPLTIQQDWWASSTGATWFTKPFFVPTSSSASTNTTETNYFKTTYGATGFAPTNPADTGAIIITFNSSGALDLVYSLAIVPNTSPSLPPIQAVFTARPYSGVYLLVGKVENVPLSIPGAASTTMPTAPNLFDGNSRWVAINRNGLVTTTEAANTPSTSTTPVFSSLRLARGSQNSVGN